MDKKLHILPHLYGEADELAELARLLEDEAVRREFKALAAAKAALDRRPPVRPDPAVLDRIFEAAATPVRQDRAPMARRARMMRLVASVCVLVIAVGVGLWQFLPASSFERASAPSADQATDFRAEAPASAEPLMAMKETESAPASAKREAAPLAVEENNAMASKAASEAVEKDNASPSRQEVGQAAAAPVAARVAASREEARADAEAPAPQGFADDAVLAAGAFAGEEAAAPESLAWDESDELLRLHRQIELLEARSAALAWDEPVRPLEVLPDPNNLGGRRGLQTTTGRKQ